MAATFELSYLLSFVFTYDLKNVSLIDVINEISNIGHVNFSYSPQIIPADKKISVKAKNKTIKEILDASIKKNGLDYIIVENQIILKLPKEKQKQSVKVLHSICKKW